jgi:hypothetical protein
MDYNLLYVFLRAFSYSIDTPTLALTAYVYAKKYSIFLLAIIVILFIQSTDDHPFGSKHAGQFLYNQNHLCICWCIT